MFVIYFDNTADPTPFIPPGLISLPRETAEGGYHIMINFNQIEERELRMLFSHRQYHYIGFYFVKNTRVRSDYGNIDIGNMSYIHLSCFKNILSACIRYLI